MTDISIVEAVVSELLTDCVQYLTFSNASPTTIGYGVRTLAVAFDYIISTPTANNLTAVWNFFVAHQNDILQEDVIFAGLGGMDATMRINFIMRYSWFRQAVSGATIGPIHSNIATSASYMTLFQFFQTNGVTVEFGDSINAAMHSASASIVTGTSTLTKTSGMIVANFSTAGTLILPTKGVDPNPPLVIKRLGSGTVSISGNIDGVAQTITLSSATLHETVILSWSDTAASWMNWLPAVNITNVLTPNVFGAIFASWLNTLPTTAPTTSGLWWNDNGIPVLTQ
jgi:hypothetical protein